MKKLLDTIHPGEFLLEDFMKPMKISINRLTQAFDVPPNRISEIVNGIRGISADTTLRLAKFFGTSTELWLELQTEYELRVARRAIGPEVERRVHAYAD